MIASYVFILPDGSKQRLHGTAGLYPKSPEWIVIFVNSNPNVSEGDLLEQSAFDELIAQGVDFMAVPL